MTVVPDSIEPVEEWRTWTFNGERLLSHNGVEWTPGEPHKAECMAPKRHVWTIVRGGWSREHAGIQANSHNSWRSNMVGYTSFRSSEEWLSSPTVEPPDGYGYALEAVQHDAPDPDCTCGIYAARNAADCPGGDVVGKVKLWGTIIPGTKGSRAQFAYPSELHVPARLADDAALLAYGVPVVAVSEQEIAAMMPPPRGTPRSLRIAIAINLAAAGANLTALGLRYLL